MAVNPLHANALTKTVFGHSRSGCVQKLERREKLGQAASNTRKVRRIKNRAIRTDESAVGQDLQRLQVPSVHNLNETHFPHTFATAPGS